MMWQLQNLSVIDGVPEPLLMPHTAEELKIFVINRPREAAALLSVKQLREAGADPALIAERLDYGDGIMFHIAFCPHGVTTTQNAEMILASTRDALESTRNALASARNALLRDLRSRGGLNDQLPIKCTLETSHQGVCVMAGSLHLGFVPDSFVATLALGEARIVSITSSAWKARALPAESVIAAVDVN